MTDASIALYISAASLTVSAWAMIIAVNALRETKKERARNDEQNKALAGLQGWTANMQRTTEDNNKQMGRIVSHLTSERRTRSELSNQVYIMLDAISEKVGIDTEKRKEWKGSTLPILKAMQEDAEK